MDGERRQLRHPRGIRAVLRIGGEQRLNRLRGLRIHRAVLHQTVEQGAVRTLGRAGERRIARHNHVAALKIRAVDHSRVVNAAILRRSHRRGIGEIARRFAVSERAQQERRIHLRRAGLVRRKVRFGRAGGQAVLVQILHIGLLPAHEVGKGRGIGQRLRFLLRAQKAHQHDARFRAGGRAVELVARLRAAEQAERFQPLRTGGILRRKGGHGQQRSQCSAGQSGAQPMVHNRLLLLLLLSYRCCSIIVPHPQVFSNCKTGILREIAKEC